MLLVKKEKKKGKKKEKKFFRIQHDLIRTLSDFKTAQAFTIHTYTTMLKLIKYLHLSDPGIHSILKAGEID